MALYLPLLTTGLVIYLVSLVYRTIRRNLSIANASRKHGCKPPTIYPSIDPLFSIDTLVKTFKRIAAGNRIQWEHDIMKKAGGTVCFTRAGSAEIWTSDPRNVHILFSGKFENFGVAPTREIPMSPLTGPGVLISDGPTWVYTRKLVRKSLSKSQIADPACFEIHVSRFMDLLPKDGSTVDLHPLLVNLVSKYAPPAKASHDQYP
jgi:cytochrome P450